MVASCVCVYVESCSAVALWELIPLLFLACKPSRFSFLYKCWNVRLLKVCFLRCYACKLPELSGLFLVLDVFTRYLKLRHEMKVCLVLLFNQALIYFYTFLDVKHLVLCCTLNYICTLSKTCSSFLLKRLR